MLKLAVNNYQFYAYHVFRATVAPLDAKGEAWCGSALVDFYNHEGRCYSTVVLEQHLRRSKALAAFRASHAVGQMIEKEARGERNLEVVKEMNRRINTVKTLVG